MNRPLFRFHAFRTQKARLPFSQSASFLRKPVVFYNEQKKRTQIFWGRVTTTVLFLTLVWDTLAHGGKLEEEMQALTTMAYGDFTQMGVGGGTIIGVVISIFKQSPGMFGIVLSLGVGLSFYLRWVKNHKFGT